MSWFSKQDQDDVCSEFGDKEEVGFLDFEDDKSLHDFDPLEESGPVIISLPFPFSKGKPRSALINETASDKITIKNTTSEPLDIWSISIFSSNPEDSYKLSVTKPPTDECDEASIKAFIGLTRLDDRTLQPGQTFTIWLSCIPKEIGLHTSIVHFDVGDEKIERVAFLLAEDQISRFLFSGKPFSRGGPGQKKRIEHNGFVAGERQTHQHQMGYKFKLPVYAIPKNVREILENKQIPEVLLEQLNAENYSAFFSMLIVMEELHLEEDIRAHDMECVQMKRRGMYLTLEVPGLAERRPSLVSGDYILAKLPDEYPSSTQSYQGFIHRVEADEIYLRFHNAMHLKHADTNVYNVSFTYNRMNMRRLYKAVNSVGTLEDGLQYRLLFPSPAVAPPRVLKRPPFEPFNANLNQEQCDSVGMILACKGTPPYVIFGPPGTGKTITLVESILQLCWANPKSRILVCSSSNNASDHILSKILESSNSESLITSSSIFRLNATSRSYDDISADHIRFCFFEDLVFRCPPLRALMRYKIIISTYMSASMLQSEGIVRGHFSHIFLDEAGQSSEPETMVPITGLVDKNTAVVLAGDPMQLGPVVFSSQADKTGLGTSYLERLCRHDWYANGNNNYITKLVRNYRCHPAILDLPSKLFYKGELVPCRQSDDSMDQIYDALGLPNKSFPVLFIGIQGCDEREGNNPSWFNRIEASKVVEIIKKITDIDEIPISEIGVITPYRQQVLKLKKALEMLEMEEVKVGSVEQFQGQEREVIIVSTVRSTVRHNEFDRVHQLGFLSNHRRFNVAITRAKSLLVVVGNPHVISKDRYWDRLLRYCADNGSYVGCPLPAPESHIYPEENDDKFTTQEIPQSCDDTWHDESQTKTQVTNETSRDGWNYTETGECSKVAEFGAYEAEWTDDAWNVDPDPNSVPVMDPAQYEKNPEFGAYETGECSKVAEFGAYEAEWTDDAWNVDPDPNSVPVMDPAQYEKNPEWYDDAWYDTVVVDPNSVPVTDLAQYEKNPERYDDAWNDTVVEEKNEIGQCSNLHEPGRSKSGWNGDPQPIQRVDPVRLVIGQKGLKQRYIYGWSDLSEIKPTGWED